MARKFILILPVLAALGALFLFAWPDDLQDDDAVLPTQSDVMKESTRSFSSPRREERRLSFATSTEISYNHKLILETIGLSPALESLSTCVLRC
jgi:hypothetical protein